MSLEELACEGIDDEYYDETGNELNLLDFTVGPTRYGINILKIKKIVAFRSIKLVQLPDAARAVLGMFPSRDI